MKKLILASMILLATGAAQATVAGLATSGSGTTPVSGQNTVQIALTNQATTPQLPIAVTYSASNNGITNTHNTGAVAQYAAITVPTGTQKVVLSNPLISGTNLAHAAVSIIADVNNTAGDANKIYATAVGGDTLYVGLVAADDVVWAGGETTGLATVTFYAS
ncbi:hypothetical protein MM424_002299 [Salmonella enterica]|nr:hypothetical protein [Salmonella enterica]